MEQENNQDLEIDLLSLFRLIIRKWWLIGIITFAGLVLAGSYAYLVLDDTYTAESSMIVQVTESGDSAASNLSTGTRLVDTYAEIAKSNRALDELIANLHLELTTNQVKNMISVNSVNNTLIIELVVTSEDPVLAKEIANELVSIVQGLSTEFDGLETIEILDIAIVATTPSGPNRTLYLVIGILLGAMIGVGLILALEFLDKNIKTGKDIENKLGLRLLGTIPEYDMNEGVDENGGL